MPGTYNTSVRSYRYYQRDPISGGTGPSLLATWTVFPLIDQGDGTNFLSTGIVISNDDAANELQFSFDGVTVDGDLLHQESQNFFMCRHKKVYLRGTLAAPYRIWAW